MYRKKAGDILFNIFNYLIMIFVIVVTLYPFINTLAVSLNDAVDTVRGGIHIWPREFSLFNYRSVLTDTSINLKQAFIVSTLRTVTGTVLSLFCTAMLAYTLSRKEFIFRKLIASMYVLTMYFSGGLIPTYLLIKELHMINSFWVYIVPNLLTAFNVIVIRSYMEGISVSLLESAKIDGAGEFRIFLTIVMPLCAPVMATIALFIAVSHWNSWFDTFLYIPSKPELSTLQFELMKVLSTTSRSPSLASINEAVKSGRSAQMVTPTSIQAAITIVTIVPIILVYPFLQKYYITGMTLGGVKE